MIRTAILRGGVLVLTLAIVIAPLQGAEPIPAVEPVVLLGVAGAGWGAPFAAPSGRADSPEAPVSSVPLSPDKGSTLRGLPFLQRPSVPASGQQGSFEYTVRPGDTLSELAARFLGDASLWPRIYRMNTDLIQDPDLILVGWTLRIPGRGTAERESSQEAPASGSRSTSPAPSGASSAELESWKGGKLPPDKFIRMIGPVAREVYRRTGVPASVTLAQAIIETGWGDATIGDAKNLFGIKGTGPAGTITVPTKEFVNGRYITVNDSFRKYRSWVESVEDHAQFLKENSRYKKAFQFSRNADQFAREIADAGYATDPAYASKLIKLMKEFDLYGWDR